MILDEPFHRGLEDGADLHPEFGRHFFQQGPEVVCDGPYRVEGVLLIVGVVRDNPGEEFPEGVLHQFREVRVEVKILTDEPGVLRAKAVRKG